MPKRIFILLMMGYSFAAAAQNVSYPDKKLPADKPLIFSKGLISDGMNNRDFTISPAGDEIFYSVQQRDFSVSVILRMVKKNNQWTGPEVAPFSGGYNDLEAVFSPDGKKIYFCSNRPSSAADTTDDFDIWFVNKTATGWSEPVHAGFVINSPGNEFYPSVARNGNIYFTATPKEGKGSEDIVMCEWKNGAYAPPVSLPDAINSKNDEYNAFIDPDEQFILFTAPGRTGGFGRGDIYLSKKDAGGNWLPATNLGPGINTAANDYCPYVTPDKKFFFFSSSRSLNKTPFTQQYDYKQISSMLKNAGNGLDDIYWMQWPFDSAQGRRF